MFKKELGEDLSHENVRVNGNASPAGKRPTEVVYLSDTDDECDADNDVTCLSPAAVSIISLNDDEASFQGVEDAEKVNKIPEKAKENDENDQAELVNSKNSVDRQPVESGHSDDSNVDKDNRINSNATEEMVVKTMGDEQSLVNGQDPSCVDVRKKDNMHDVLVDPDEKTEMSDTSIEPNIDDIVSDMLELNRKSMREEKGNNCYSDSKGDSPTEKEDSAEPMETEEISSSVEMNKIQKDSETSDKSEELISEDKSDENAKDTNESNVTSTIQSSNLQNTDRSNSVDLANQQKEFQNLSMIRIESTVSISYDAFDDSEKRGEITENSDKQNTQSCAKDNSEEQSNVNPSVEETPLVSTSEQETEDAFDEGHADESVSVISDESTTAEINPQDKQAPDSTVITPENTTIDLPVPAACIKQEPVDPEYAAAEEFRSVQIKSEPISGDEQETNADSEGVQDQVDDPNLDMGNKSCLICKYRFTTCQSLIRHGKTKAHQAMLLSGIKREGNITIHPKSLLKQALIRKRRRKGPFYRPKRYVCKECNVVFSSSSSLARHNRCHDKLKLRVNCEMTDDPLDVEPETSDEMIPDIKHLADERDYICPMPNCNYSCKEGATLLTHMTSHGINKIKNQNLPKSSPSQVVPKVEMKEYRCDYHDVVFYDRRGYGNHLRTCKFGVPLPRETPENSSPKYFCCKLCNLKFASKEVHLNHLRVYHRGPLPENAQTQQQQIQKASFLARASQLKNRRQNAYCCKTCGKKFNFLYSLNYHLKSHQQVTTSAAPQVTTCKICKKSFQTYKVYRVHIKSHFLPPGSRKLFCSKCFKIFDTRSEIGLHRSRGQCKVINKLKIFTCSVCNTSFKEQEELNRHKENDCIPPSAGSSNSPWLPTNEETNTCNLCNKSFSNFANLKRHCMMVHRMSQPAFQTIVVNYPKEDNESETDVKVTVKQEVDETKDENVQDAQSAQNPQSEEMFSCNYCDKSFRLQRILTLHLNNFCRNSPNRPKCGHCGMFVTKKGCEGCAKSNEAAMNQNEQYYMGMSSMGEHPLQAIAGSSSSAETQLYSCPIGKMSFTNEKSMLRHYSYCNGECTNVINCSNCGKGFKTLKFLETHTCIKNKKPYRYNCIKCMRSFSRKNYLVNHESKCIGYSLDDGPLDQSSLVDIKPNITNSPKLDQTPVSSTTDVFRCDLCPKVFQSLKGIAGHKWVHKPRNKLNRVQTFECKFCMKDNIILSQLYPHNYKCIRAVLMSQDFTSCPDCDSFFSREDGSKELAAKVQNHVIMCYRIPYYKNQDQSENSPKLLCCYCGYAFSSVESLTAHKTEHMRMKKMKTMTQVRPRKKIKTNNSQALGVHFLDNFIEEEVPQDDESQIEEVDGAEYMEYEQTDDYTDSSISDQPYNCSVCSRQFSDVDKLINHEKVHGIVQKTMQDEIEMLN